jgi:hypothetical protein
MARAEMAWWFGVTVLYQKITAFQAGQQIL